MPERRHHVKLKDKEYIQLRQYVRDGGKAVRAVKRARILLLADEQRPDEEIAEILGVGSAPIHRVRKNDHEGGLERALQEKPRSGAPVKIDGRVEATLTMLACADPPDGYGLWTLQLLADKLVARDVIESIALPTVRTVLKKMS